MPVLDADETQPMAPARAGPECLRRAKPEKDRRYPGWSGGVCAGTALTCTVPMLGNLNVQAPFN